MTKILLIEDHPTNRKLFGDLLRRSGYEVVAVESADKGIALTHQEEFHLIVMDIQLPGMDGLTATKLLRRSLHAQHIPVLAVTAHAMRGDEERVMAAGCDGYVAKPVAYQEFLAAVARLLRSGRTHSLPLKSPPE